MKEIKEYDLIHGGLYKVDKQIVRYNAVRHRFYVSDRNGALGYLTRMQRSHKIACCIGIKDSEGFYSIWKNHYVTPIPLTADILQKNGWKRLDEAPVFRDIYVLDYGRNHIEVRMDKMTVAVWLNYDEDNGGVYADCFLPMPATVHEFQHILRVCLCQELADNFKVE